VTKKALITGITGQDGSYLAEYLLNLGYEVHGIVRRVALEAPETRFSRLSQIVDRLTLHPATLESYPSIYHIISRHDFDECYHLAAQSFVAESFSDGFSTMNININGTHYVLAALRDLRPRCRFYFAGSSEMFGKAEEVPQTEMTKFHPRSPYGISKVAGFHLTRNYRDAYQMYCVSGILFNHESPRRGFEFVTRKVTNAVAQIKLGQASELKIGNLEAKRDWGHAADYVRAMHMMLQQPTPDDYVIDSGQHRLLNFALKTSSRAMTEWVFTGDQFIGLDNNRNGVGVGGPGQTFAPGGTVQFGTMKIDDAPSILETDAGQTFASFLVTRSGDTSGAASATPRPASPTPY